MNYGAEYTMEAQEREVCGNCQKVSDELILLANGWNFRACPECAEWCKAEELAEPCPDLHRAVVIANSIEEVRLALRAHQGANCVHCGSTKKTVMGDRLVAGSKDTTCCQVTPRKEVA